MKSYSKKSDVVALLNELVEYGILAVSGKGVYYPAGTYYLAHGETSSPDYRPAHYRDGWSVSVEYHYQAGTIGAPPRGRTRASIENFEIELHFAKERAKELA